MRVLKYFLEDEVDRYTSVDFYIDCRSSPDRLLRDLRSAASARKLAKFLDSSSKNPMKLIRGLTLANLLLLYSRDWFRFVEEHLRPRPSRDEWLNDKFLGPYAHFLEKVCTSRAEYLEAVSLGIRRGQALEMLFYCTNMLHLLFRVVEKMPLIGRYYKQQHSPVICSAIETIAAQAQRLYAAFKHSLSEILYRREEYIRTREDEAIMRGMLVEELAFINEEMKKLFLDKYFYPLGKGIGIKLFRPEEQTQECERAINAIVSNHQNTERQKRHQELERTLFPGSGLVNWNFYEETLLSAPMLDVTAKGTGPNYKDLDDLAISEEEEAAEQEHEWREGKAGKEGKGKEGRVESGKETNSGTAQENVYQL